MAATGRIPVFMRVGTGGEYCIGSLDAEDVSAGPGVPARVRVAGGALATAELLEAAAAELRRQHAVENSG